MRHSPRTSLASLRWSPAVLALLATNGCALPDGDPWGRAELSLEVALDGAATRLDERGRIRTANDYLVRLDALEIELGDLRLRMGTSGATLAFDPADPPPEYSLCHNGHCHHEDGRLVDYEDIAAELSGTSADAGPERAARVQTDVVLEPGSDERPAWTPVAVPVTCADGCALERGSLRSLELDARRVRLRGHVTDRRQDAAARLSRDEVPFAIELREDLVFSSPLEGNVDRGEPVLVRVATELVLDVRVLDALPWASLETDADALLPPLRDALLEHARAQVDVSRPR